MKNIIIAVAILILTGLGFYLFQKNSRTNSAISGCDQSATTTDCAKLSEVSPATQSYVAPEYKWRQYTNNEFGISFSYPSDMDQGWSVSRGDTGKQFGGTVELPSKSTLNFVAHTHDYTAPKDGVLVSTEGYVIKDGKYYVISRGKPSTTPFIPDEILKLKDSTPVLILYKKQDFPCSDYQPPDIAAMINITNNNEFTCMGFMLYIRSYPKLV